MKSSTASHYEAHYTSGELRARIEGMLQGAGMSAEQATHEQMSAFDQFHVRGVLATKDLVAMAGFKPSDHVLDVGSGIGGTSRFLNHEVGCRVTGIDLTQEFVDVANWLTAAQRQGDKVDFVQGSALETPFDDASFDGAWMQHVNMNIADKRGLFTEVARVLKPRARFVMHEIIADKADQPHFPAPWARNADGSHLATEPEFRSALEAAGFEVTAWHDETQKSVDWMSDVFAKMKEQGAPPINVGVILGPEFGEMAANANRSMQEGRIKVVSRVATKR